MSISDFSGLGSLAARGSAADREFLSKSELLVWMLAVLCVAYVSRSFGYGSLEYIKLAFQKIDIFLFFAFGVSFWRLRQVDTGWVCRSDFVYCTILCLALMPIALLPQMIGLGIGFGCLALLLRYISKEDQNSFAASVLLMAIATHLAFAPIFFRLFLQTIIAIDVQIVSSVMSALRPDLYWIHTTLEGMDGDRKFGITLMGGCSSFNNISGAILVHMTWAMALRTHLTKLDAIALIITVILATLVNVLRIVLTAWNTAGFDFWHGDGSFMPLGAFIFFTAQTVLLITTGYLTAVYAGKTQS